MPKVDLIATKDFTYMTRRLTAGDAFQARNPLEARILTRVRKTAEVPPPAKIGEVATKVIEHAKAAAPKDETRAAPKPAAKKAPAKTKPGQAARKRKAAAKK